MAGPKHRCDFCGRAAIDKIGSHHVCNGGKCNVMAISDKDSAVNIVDPPEDGNIEDCKQLSQPEEYPAGEAVDTPSGAGETSHHMPRQAQTQQLDEYSRGPASLFAVLSVHGIDTTQEELKDQLGTNEEHGTSLRSMTSVINSYGLNAEVLKGLEKDDLIERAQDNSIIVYYQDHDENCDEQCNSCGHYSTLESVDDSGLNIFDPYTDEIEYMTWPEFEKNWHGELGDRVAIVINEHKQAERGQGLTDLVTEKHVVKPNQKLTEPGRWSDSYHNVNTSEDVDLKLGETDDTDSLSTPVNPPYTGLGPVDKRYEDASPKQRNIVVHATETEDADINKGPKQFWVAVDLDGTILKPPPEGIYQDQSGKHCFGEPISGSREALQELVDGGAKVSIYTARQYFMNNEEDEIGLQTAVAKKLDENNIPYTDIYIGKKPPAHYYIDDKAIQFKNDWAAVLDAVHDKLTKNAADDKVKSQKEYKGIKVNVEWPKGSIRSYAGDDTYVTHMGCDYGYAQGVEGTDQDSLDIYLGDADADVAFIVEQLKDDGSYDEDKVMLGFNTEAEAADMYLQHMPSYMLGDIREVPVDKLKNALYGNPEDRRGEEDLVPSEEMNKSAFNLDRAIHKLRERKGEPEDAHLTDKEWLHKKDSVTTCPKCNKEMKYDDGRDAYVCACGHAGENSPSDKCECGHSREEHDGAGCFADPETCECNKQPGMFSGEADEIEKVALHIKLASYRDYAEKILKSLDAELVSELFRDRVDFTKDSFGIISDIVRVMLTDGGLLKKLESIFGPVEIRRPVEQIEKTVAPRRDPGPHDTRVLEPDKASGVANPDWPNDESLDTDPTEDRESRDIPRQPNKENILYRNT